MFGVSPGYPGLMYHDHFKGRKKTKAKRRAVSQQTVCFSSFNIITGDGNHTALKRKQISILFHDPNE